MAKERLREDARLIGSSDHTLGCDFPIDLHLQRVCARTCLVALLRAPREDFERASIPTQPLKFPCPIQCSAWAVSILVGSVKCLHAACRAIPTSTGLASTKYLSRSYCMEAIIFGIWSLSIRYAQERSQLSRRGVGWSCLVSSSLEMTSMITFLVFVLALILAVFAFIVVGSALQVRAAWHFRLPELRVYEQLLLQRMHRGSITAFLIIAISPVPAS